MTQTISLHAVPRPEGGYFYEDYVVGRRFHHVTPRTLTDGDAALYIALTGARQPVHCCAPLALAMGHRACPLDDFLVFNVAFGKTVLRMIATKNFSTSITRCSSRGEVHRMETHPERA